MESFAVPLPPPLHFDPMLDAARVFETHRPGLLRLAHRMLGSRAEAEDVVQEAFLRFGQAASVDRPGAFLTTVVTRLALDQLRSARRQRVDYPGLWLPEVPDPGPAPGASRELADNLSFAFLAMLERLTTEQRAVFVLREAFQLEHAEVAKMLGLSPEAVRKLFSRARRRMRDAPVGSASPEQASSLATRFVAACQAGSLRELQALLAEDAVFQSDGGGHIKAARRRVLGAERVAKMLVGLRRKYWVELRDTGRRVGTSLLLSAHVPTAVGAVLLDLRGEAVGEISVQWNREKLPPDLRRGHTPKG